MPRKKKALEVNPETGEPLPAKQQKTPAERWNAESARRVKQLRKAFVRVTRMGNRKQYDGPESQVQEMLKRIREDMADMERAFKAAPTEKGLFDL